MGAFLNKTRQKNEGNNFQYDPIRNPDSRKEIEDSLGGLRLLFQVISVQQMISVLLNQQLNDVQITHSTPLLKSEISSYIRPMDSTNKQSYQFSKINLSFDSLKILVSGKNTLGTNIELLYIFRAYREIEVILGTNSGKIYCFGHNWNGVLGFGHDYSIEEFTVNEDLSNKQLVEFKSSECHTLGRTRNGKLFSWGCNYWGCLGNGRVDRKKYKPEVNKYLIDENIIDMCCGYRHTLVLTSKNEVYAWGDNDKGQIGNGSNADVVSIPFKVKELNGEKVNEISCGFDHSMALTQSGCVYSWGNNRWGQLGVNDGLNEINRPKPIEIEVKIKKISCGYRHSLLLSSEGDIYAFGWNKYKQLGINTKNLGFKADEEILLFPTKLNHSEKFIEIASHYQYNISAALSKDGFFYVWGNYGEERVICEPGVTYFESFDEIFSNLIENHS